MLFFIKIRTICFVIFFSPLRDFSWNKEWRCRYEDEPLEPEIEVVILWVLLVFFLFVQIHVTDLVKLHYES